MAFDKIAKMEQAFIKMSLYGKLGSGKTLTSLLFSEGLAKREGKKVAYIDTERSTDFYAKAIPRKVHPEAFEFYPEHTRELYKCIDLVENFDTEKFGVLVVDSITHLWEAAQLSYTGKLLLNGAIPPHAWAEIKKPYKDFITLLMNLQAHVLICGRENVEFQDFSNKDAPSSPKMNAEKDTGHETPFLLNMQFQRFDDSVLNLKKGDTVVLWEKDRSGLQEGKFTRNPNYLTLEPIVKLLFDGKQPEIKSLTEIEQNAKFISEEKKKEKVDLSAQIRIDLMKKIQSCNSLDTLITLWETEIDKSLKKMYVGDREIVIKLKDEIKNILSTRKMEEKS